MIFWTIVGLSVAGYAIFRLYMMTVKATCDCKTDLTGKTVIVTGSDKNIGYYTALNMAQRNARVILACRNVESARKAANEIQLKAGNKNVVVEEVEMSLLQSVRRFADKINRNEPRLDILIHNAATGDTSDLRTEDGLQLMFATNYVGPFLLTHLLLDKLKKSAPSRIVNVASIAHKLCGQLDLTNLNSEKNHVPKYLYQTSKLALVMYTRELSKRLAGTGVVVNSVHPGSADTNLLSRFPWPANSIVKVISKIFFRTAEEGAQTTIHVAVSDELKEVSGQYFSECKIANPSKHALDDAVAKKLYERSEYYAQLQ